MSSPPDAAVPKLLYQADLFFNEIYDRGLQVTGTPEAKRRRERFYNLVQFSFLSSELDGLIAECGCWRGLSSFILCHHLKRGTPSFDGSGYHIFDSFKGLSKPTHLDALSESVVAELTKKFGHLEGAFAASLPDVQSALAEFPGIEYHEGWIPSVFDTIPEGQYRFVHIDLDLYEPTRASLEYFYPRLVNGGLIVCDDYGSLLWPGAKQAVESFSIESNVPFIRVSTGQALIWKRGPIARVRSGIPSSLRRSLADAQLELSRSRAEHIVTEENARSAQAALTQERDELKARMNEFSKRFAEVKAEGRAKRDELATRMAHVREERNKEKARALHFAKRLAEVKEELRELKGNIRKQTEHSDH